MTKSCSLSWLSTEPRLTPDVSLGADTGRDVPAGTGGAAIDDIISLGEDRHPRPWRRCLGITAVIIVVLAALIINHLPGGGRPRHHHHPQAAPSPVAASQAPEVIRPARPDGIPGPTASWAAGLRLPVAGQQPRWLWPATGRTEPITGLPRARPGYLFTRIRGGWAVQQAPAGAAGCADCAGPPLPVYFLADRAQAATLVGVADKVAPADAVGAMWLTSYPVRVGLGSAVGIAQEVSASGAPLGPRVRLPAGYAIDAATDRGLLLVPAVQGATPTYRLWNPTLDRVGGIFSGVIAADADEIAWAPPCVSQCVVRVLHLTAAGQARAGETDIALPALSSAANGAFSPDGRLLALELTFGNGGNGGIVATQLEVASVGSDHLTVVPGSWASSDALAGFGWPSDDDSLVAELSFMTKVQVASWRFGAAGWPWRSSGRDRIRTS